MAAHEEIRIEEEPDASRYVAKAGGRRAGTLVYRRRPGMVTATHTEVDSHFEGKGLGGRLAERLLADARERGETVVAQCPFVGDYIDRHPEYADLVARD